MSVFRWRYTEECEGRYCCGDCDKCDKEDEEMRELRADYIKSDYMTPYEFTDAMWRVRIDPDGTPEDKHIKADDLMCELLTKLGYGDGVKEFEKMERWYS